MKKVSNKMTSNSKQINVDNTIMNGILTIVDTTQSPWLGTMTDLSKSLIKTLGRKQSEMLPGSPGALRIILNRITNRLRSRKISVRFSRTKDHSRTRLVQFTR